MDNLKKQIRPFILRRKKKDVVKELPDKIENNIYIELNKEQKKIYLAELEKTKKRIKRYGNLLGNKTFISKNSKTTCNFIVCVVKW